MGSSTNISRPVSADTEALVGSEGSTLARDQAISVGGNQGSIINLGGTALSRLVGGNNTGTLNINDPNALKPITDTLTDTVNRLADSRDLDSQRFTELVQQQAAQNAALAESKQTDGVSSLGKLALWGLAIAAVAFIAAVVNWKNRS